MLLLLVATTLGFLSVHATLLGKQILKWINKPSTKEKELLIQKNELTKVQKSISITDHFAKYSRLQRQINKIDEELTNSRSEKNSLTIHLVLTYGLKLFFIVILIGLSLYYRSTPIIALSDNYDFTPFSYLISYPHSGNAVSFHFWVLCSTSTARLINV